MATCQEFPKDWHEFIKDNSFKDSQEVYTNGSELIPVFRVEQLIEHLLNEQEAAYQGAVELLRQKTILFDDAIKRLKEHDPVKPRVSSVEQRCGNCNKIIEMDGWKACPWCGKPILWEAVGRSVKGNE